MEINPQYKDKIFFFIFIKFAHQAYIQHSKVIINETNGNQELTIMHLFDNEEHEDEHEEERQITILKNRRQQLTN